MYYTGNLFELALRELEIQKRKGKIKNITELNVIDTAIKIRKWLDKYGQKGIDTERILGKKAYQAYSNKKKSYRI